MKRAGDDLEPKTDLLRLLPSGSDLVREILISKVPSEEVIIVLYLEVFAQVVSCMRIFLFEKRIEGQ